MPDPQTGSDTWEATINLLFDGEDVTYATLMQGIILKIMNRTVYAKNRVDVVYSDAHSWAALQTFAAGATFTGPVAFSGDAATTAKRHNDTACTAGANATIDATTADIFRVPSTLGGNRTYTIKKAAPVPPTGYTVRFYRTLTASAHTVVLQEETSARLLVGWDASKPAWVDLIWDGTKWHSSGWDADAGAATNETSNP